MKTAKSVSLLITFLLLAGCGGSGKSEETVNPNNQPPVANAGEDVSYLVGEKITLDCEDSGDVDSDVFNIQWKQISGYPATIANASECLTEVTLPVKGGEVEFELVVTDGENSSRSDTLIATVLDYQGEKAALSSKEPLLYQALLPNHLYFSVSGDFYYLGTYNELRIYNIETLTSPELVGSLVFEDRSISNIQVVGTLGYLHIEQDDSLQFLIVDLSEPNNPSIISQISRQDKDIISYLVHDELLYALTEEELVIYDLSDLSEISIVATIVLPSVEWGGPMHYANNTLYIGGSERLTVIDVANPIAPQLISSEAIGSISSIEIVNEHMFVGLFSNGDLQRHINIYEITTPNTPVLINEFDTGSSYYRLAIDDNQMFVLASESQQPNIYIFDFPSHLHVYDITDVYNPRYIGEIETSGDAYRISTSSQQLFLNDGSVYQVPKPSPNQLSMTSGQLEIEGGAVGLVVDGNTAYLARGANGIDIIDVSDSAEPELIRTLKTHDHISEIAKKDSLLLTVGGAHSTGMNAFDVADINQPKFLGNYDQITAGHSMSVKGEYVYLSGYPEGLHIVDIADPSDVRRVGIFDGIDNVRNVAVGNDKAFVARGYQELDTFDISNPKSPKLISRNNDQVGLNVLSDVALNQDESVLFSVRYGFDIGPVNSCFIRTGIKSLAEPTDLGGSCTSSFFTNFDYQNNMLFGATESGVHLADALATNMKKGFYKSERGDRAVVVNDNKIYVASDVGLSIYDDLLIIDSEQQYAFAGVSESLSYQFSWHLDIPVLFKCVVSGGDCQVSVNENEKTTEIIWQLPSTAGHYEISVVSGNINFYLLHHDQVIVE